MGGRLSGLTTRGRCMLAGGLATAGCAVLLDERDLLRIGAFVALLPLLALLVARRTRRSVAAERTLRPARLAVGGGLRVDLLLRGGRLLSTLRLTDAVPDAAGPQADTPPRFTVHSLGRSAGTAGRSAAITYRLRPALRGAHRIGPLTASSTDPLGLAQFEQTLAPATTLLVVPRVVGLVGVPPALGAGEGTPGAALAHQGQGSSDVLVRPYRVGDELRRVHWRSTARYDELMVRLEERPWRGGTTLLLDRRDSAHRGRGAGSSLEYGISMAASIYAHLVARGEPITMVAEDGTELAAPGASHGTEAMLDVLAQLRSSARADLGGPELSANADVLAVLGELGPGQLESLQARRPGGGYAVLLDTATWDAAGKAGSGPGAQATAAALRGAGWGVVVATASTSPVRAWDELVAAAAARVQVR
ncbi:DUF58 domain-containing protein [Pseudonocardia humida]|uniref:DUF58 domain-containing protein n=1 Tax=Pseudonocardia humida TaxID=2800819 RepID=A0ABT0ZYR6_9PSEU|nr:DUF58 domain-containing protein [Pseudonocardia humida]MCO1655882.1 DUF58 domain-containing protein [Pseudonocardia humida]